MDKLGIIKSEILKYYKDHIDEFGWIDKSEVYIKGDEVKFKKSTICTGYFISCTECPFSKEYYSDCLSSCSESFIEYIINR